jgi:hypothetical protein
MPDRHEKLAQALGLIMSLAATRYGRTMTEMMEELDCSRRTAARRGQPPPRSARRSRRPS